MHNIYFSRHNFGENQSKNDIENDWKKKWMSLEQWDAMDAFNSSYIRISTLSQKKMYTEKCHGYGFSSSKKSSKKLLQYIPQSRRAPNFGEG